MTTSAPAATRLLRTASELFCREGIRAVGIDRILAESGVAKATLYQAFGSKDALVVAHLEQRDVVDRRRYRAAVAALPAGPERVLASFDLAVDGAREGGFVGCVYLNALTEYPDAGHVVARAVAAHREWLLDAWREALAAYGDAADELAREAQIAYDGGLVGSRAARDDAPIRRARALVAARLAAAANSVPAAG